MNDDKIPTHREVMRRQVEELVRHRVSSLPEIKQEIRRYIEIGKASEYSSNLQETLSHLEELPDIQEILKENDSQKLFSIDGKLERIKSTALLEILTMRTTIESRLNDGHAGRHITKDSSGQITNDFFVNRMWTVDILPSFDVPARIVTIYQPTYCRITFGVGVSPNNISSSVAQVELSNGWADPLEPILCKLDLFHDESGLSLDGIEYDFCYSTRGSETHIRFSNPTYSQFIEFERAFFSVAETVANTNGQSVENDYLAIWRKYLAKQKNA